jgi:L-lysine 2,3-aminomutase
VEDGLVDSLAEDADSPVPNIIHLLKTSGDPARRDRRIHTGCPVISQSESPATSARRLSKYHPVYVNVHFTHPDELTPAARHAQTMLADAGCPRAARRCS